jgi:hypothetical protein
MIHDPMLDGITRYRYRYLGDGMEQDRDGFYVAFSDLPALLAAAREEAAEAAMQIGRQIEKDNHAAGLCEPSYTHGREYQQQRLTNHDMHSGLACLTNYEQGQRDERERLLTDALWKRGQALFLTEGDIDRLRRLVQRDEREACIDTVWLVRDEKGYSNPEWQERIVAAIRAREEKPCRTS